MSNKKISRMLILMIMMIVLTMGLLVRLFQLQIVHGEEYAENFKLKTKREIVLEGTRGNIYDRNGNMLARNQLAYAVTFEDSETYKTDRERQLTLNGIIYQMIQLIKENEDSMEQTLKITVDENGTYQFTAEGFALERFKADIFGRSKIEDMDETEQNASAEEIVTYLCGEEKFSIFMENGKPYTKEEKVVHGLPEEMNKEDLLEMLSVRYALFLQTYQKYLPVVVARDVSQETVAAVLEAKGELPGVNIKEESIRVYEGGEAFASILGYTGTISPEELKEKGEEYTINSVVGKAGIEQYLNDELQGKDGKKEVYVDNMGRVMEDAGVVKKPQAGKDVVLSIDMELQQAAYEALEQKITEILLENLINTKTFDKTTINDTTEIRIPIYDVYTAFFTNGVINLSHFEKEEASELEREIYQRFLGQKEKILIEIKEELEQTETVYQELSDEMKEYQRFLTETSSIWKKEKIDKKSENYKKWNKGELSLAEYLREAIKEDWISLEKLGTEETYLQQEEIFALTMEYLLNEVKQNKEFDKIVYKYMILKDEISPEESINLLYEQGKFTKDDDAYEVWSRGGMSTYDFVRQKIQNQELTPADLALDPASGSVVVTDTKTGKVLACVTYPGYDNNRLANQMDNEYYYSIYQNKSLPLYNRATQQLSAPGSTFKPITIIAGMEEGVIQFSSTVYCDGVFDKVVPPLRCWNHAGHGTVTSVAGALQNSCNDYLGEVAYRLGMIGREEFSDKQALEMIQKYAKMFDLDKKSGIELTESSPQVTDQYAIPSAIGQGTNNFTTVQLGRYTNTIANKGTSFQLSLIDKVGDKTKEAKVESEIRLSAEIWNGVHTGMEWYAKNTGVFKSFPIEVAGKSGTAQEVKTRPDHSLFIGYAPAENPEISIAARIVNGYEAGNAVEVSRDVFASYFRVEE